MTIETVALGMTVAPKADRFYRAPKGGMVSTVNGRFYKGGQFIPLFSNPVEVKPVPLEGSTRQVLWAGRLRSQAIARLEDEIHARRLFLADSRTAKAVRPAIRKLLITRHNLMTERSAAKVIDRRAELV
jgi:hypothetical protein